MDSMRSFTFFPAPAMRAISICRFYEGPSAPAYIRVEASLGLVFDITRQQAGNGFSIAYVVLASARLAVEGYM